MNLAILHYHLNAGGVTRVIANHLQALDATATEGERRRVLLMFDGQEGGWPQRLQDQLASIDLTLQAIPDLEYQSEPNVDGGPLLDAIGQALDAHGFEPKQTLLHAHNHSLGKNAAFPVALHSLAERGYGVLLQPHDFAEDFRPANYRLLADALGAGSSQVYFQSARVHWATLNRRDFDALLAIGIPRERLHFLPNPVPEIESLPPREEARDIMSSHLGIEPDADYVLYPVRGIRRKNVGEFLLLSLMRNHCLRTSGISRRSYFGLTLAPQNPVARPFYERWLRLASELDLSCLFDVGGEQGMSFGHNLMAADRIVTTSVAEGFGMVFLESWLAGRPLVGRNLPEVTADFVAAGLQLGSLYDRLNVPLDWIGRESLIDTTHAACRSVYEKYGLAAPLPAAVAASIDRQTLNGMVDFANLDESLQEQVIRQAADSSEACGTLLSANPVIATWDTVGPSSITENQQVIREQYSLASSGTRLRDAYDAVLCQSAETPQVPVDGQQLLEFYLNPDRFRLIRT